MLRPLAVLLVGTSIAYGTSKLVQDGILGGALLLMILLITTRGTMGVGRSLHPANAWVSLAVVAGYILTVSALPNCVTDRYGSQFCRMTNPVRPGWSVADWLLAGFLVLGGVVLAVTSPDDPVTSVAVVGMMLAALGVAVSHYGMYGPPITNKEHRDIYHRGGVVDTTDMSVRILPGYTRTPGPEGAPRYSLLG